MRFSFDEMQLDFQREVRNVLTKSMGSKNHIAVVHATLAGLRQLRMADDIKSVRA